MKKMMAYIGEAAMCEQLAEEASELAQAALKLARIKRRENPTPVTTGEALKNLVEEYTDVEQCAMELDLHVDWDQIKLKSARFAERWEECHGYDRR